MQEIREHNDNGASISDKIKEWYRALPDKKRYVEFITAVLSIPVLLTVAIGNIRNLQVRQTPSPTPAPSVAATVQQTHLTLSPTAITPTLTQSPAATPSAQCKKEIGPIDIEFPQENQTVSQDPVCLDITRLSGDYCAVVWSYRINAGGWSDYTDKSICMYGLTGGIKNLELRIKSIVTGEEKILKRTFTIPTPSATPSASPVLTP